jgi:beta-glucanase (GH16 family)
MPLVRPTVRLRARFQDWRARGAPSRRTLLVVLLSNAFFVMIECLPRESITAVRAQSVQQNASVLKGEVAPYRKYYVFLMRPNFGSAVLADFNVDRGDKIRLAGFGISDFDRLRSLMRSSGSDVQILLPGGNTLSILNTTVERLSATSFQLELDRRGLIPTFSDEFTRFNWYAEGVPQGASVAGIWRTNLGYAGVNELGSRTLPSNHELQIYVDRGFRGTADSPLGIEPFRVVNGVLEISGDRAPPEVRQSIWNYEYTSGIMTTQPSFSQTYGVFEMRARMPKGRGLWPTFWLLPKDRSWPPEIDILEILGQETTILHVNAHSKATGRHTDAPAIARVADTSAEFHEYAVDWEPNEIRWYFDGAEVAQAPTPPDLSKPLYILVGLPIGGWPGRPDESTHFPATLAIDWVRVYKRRAVP